jgi:hypothetical protein
LPPQDGAVQWSDPLDGDFDLAGATIYAYGHPWCGLHATITSGAEVRVGDAVELVS